MDNECVPSAFCLRGVVHCQCSLILACDNNARTGGTEATKEEPLSIVPPYFSRIYEPIPYRFRLGPIAASREKTVVPIIVRDLENEGMPCVAMYGCRWLYVAACCCGCIWLWLLSLCGSTQPIALPFTRGPPYSVIP